ncbi:hypothetical protein KC878_03810 [Candidatus Saccharibacteria bacterium]|nr:hypothetical protein [Candidatus Saccharibacteria bacterium]MCB9821734.1 hypothetical protein [Candidatus Nomurabacteria bacterium]
MDSDWETRSLYEAINHPDKAKVLSTLASITVNPDILDEDGKRTSNSQYAHHSIASIIDFGIRYFALTIDEMAKTKAQAAEKERLHAEYEGMSWEEREKRGWWSEERIKVDDSKLILDTSCLDLKDVAKHMISRQMNDAFNVAYQGETRLPFFVSYRVGAPVQKILIAGIIFSKHIGGLSQAELFESASIIGGNTEMVAGAYRDFVRASYETSRYLVSGQPAGYGYTRAEAGYGLMRSSRRAAHYILEVSRVFWGHDYHMFNNDTDGSDTEMPHFTRQDALFMATGEIALKVLVDKESYFDPLDPELFLEILRSIEPNSRGKLLEDTRHLYGPSFEELAEVFGLNTVVSAREYIFEILKTGHNDILWEYYHRYKTQPIIALEIFRGNIDYHSYLFTEGILNGELTDEHRLLGITEIGAIGIEQLKKLILSIQGFIARNDKTAEDYASEQAKIKGSKVYERLWRVAVRFDDTIWGNTSSGEIVNKLYTLETQMEYPEEATAPLNTDTYQNSGKVEIVERKSEQDSMNQEAERYIDSFCEIAKLAWSEDENLDVYSDRLSDLHTRVLQIHAGLIQKLAEAKSARQAFRINQQLSDYDKIIDGSYLEDLSEASGVTGFLEACAKLGHIKPMRDALREKALRLAKENLGHELKVAFRRLLDNTSVLDDLNAVLEVVDHLIVQEFLLKLRPNDINFEAFVRRELFNTSEVRAALDRLLRPKMQSTHVKTKTLQFIPNRDIGLELSGQIGDACWATSYHSIAASMPNLTAVLIAEDMGEQVRFVGSGLFIEATTDDGEEILIIRGLNPIQNTVNQLDASDFLEKYLTYAKSTAARAGRRLAMVYDKKGSASTNRPAIHDAMSTLMTNGRLTPVSVPVEQVRFNGYGLESSIYLVDAA